tara:strand:- start:1755 stop:2027 length:273 start_codon:yes stop_codon:yes gene_type:complete
MIKLKFNKHNVRTVETKETSRVFYSLDNRYDGRPCVTLYAKDYKHSLAKQFPVSYENDTDTMTDYFDEGSVTLFEDHPHYKAARARAELN